MRDDCPARSLRISVSVPNTVSTLDSTGLCYAEVDSSARMLAVCDAPSSSALHMVLHTSKLRACVAGLDVQDRVHAVLRKSLYGLPCKEPPGLYQTQRPYTNGPRSRKCSTSVPSLSSLTGSVVLRTSHQPVRTEDQMLERCGRYCLIATTSDPTQHAVYAL
jgi:hypothetical protein